MPLLLGAIRAILEAVSWLIIIDVLLSLVPILSPRHPLAVVLRKVTRTITGPVSKILPPIRSGNGYIDLSPFIVLLLIMVVERLLLGH